MLLGTTGPSGGRGRQGVLKPSQKPQHGVLTRQCGGRLSVGFGIIVKWWQNKIRISATVGSVMDIDLLMQTIPKNKTIQINEGMLTRL